MARSYFPDLKSGFSDRAWSAVAPPPGAAAKVPQVVWLATILLAGLACLLAAVFAGLWWRGEIRAEAVELALDRMSTEAARTSHEQSRQRRVFVSAKIDHSGQIAALTDEAVRLRSAWEAALTQITSAAKARQAVVAQLEQHAAAARQQASAFQQEQSRAAVLEQNLSLTQNDLNQRAAEHDRHVDSLQTHLVSLRDTVTVREIEVRNITSAATEEIDRTRVAAQQIATEAEWLAAQLRTITCERDRLHQEVHRLEQSLQAERAANHRLTSRMSQLECRLRELEARPAPPPGSGSGPAPRPHPGSGHDPHPGPPPGRPAT